MSDNINKIIKEINKKYGENAVVLMGSDNVDLSIKAIPTQSLRLNRALGIGGLPRGRIIEIYGPESSGKSSIALGVAAEAQKMGGTVAYVDAENSLNIEHAKLLGLDFNKIYYVQPNGGEEALNITEALIRSGEIDVIIVDSVAALVPLAEAEAEMEKQHMGLQGRMMSKACRKLTAIIGKTKTVCIFINQIREKVGGYGNPETTPGGRALAFYSSVRIEVRRGEFIGDKEAPDGHITRCAIKKNRVATPHRRAEYRVIYDVGIDKYDEIIAVAAEEDIIKQKGAWFAVEINGETVQFHGAAKLTNYLIENPELYYELYNKTMDKIRAGKTRAESIPIEDIEEVIEDEIVEEE